MYLKVMSDQDKPDNNGSKCYDMYQCRSVHFYRSTHSEGATVFDPKLWHAHPHPVGETMPEAYPWAVLDRDSYTGEGVRVRITSNAYIMNDEGKTVDSFAHTDY